jgi:hypothetical protein
MLASADFREVPSADLQLRMLRRSRLAYGCGRQVEIKEKTVCLRQAQQKSYTFRPQDASSATCDLSAVGVAITAPWTILASAICTCGKRLGIWPRFKFA